MAWLLSLCATVFKLHTTSHPPFLTMEKRNWATSPGKFNFRSSKFAKISNIRTCTLSYVWTGRRTSCLNHITQQRHVTQPRIQKGSPMCVIPTDWMFENELLMNSQVSLLLVFTERKHLSTQVSWNQKKKKRQAFVLELRGTLETDNYKTRNKTKPENKQKYWQ